MKNIELKKEKQKLEQKGNTEETEKDVKKRTVINFDNSTEKCYFYLKFINRYKQVLTNKKKETWEQP